MKTKSYQQVYNLRHKYQKLCSRFQKALLKGDFALFTNRKKQVCLQRLARYERQLIQWGIPIATAAALLMNTATLVAQPMAAGAEFRVNTTTISEQSFAAVAMDNDGDFVVTWTGNGLDGDNTGIIAQRYNSAGTAQGAEFIVNSYTTSYQYAPSVAMDGDGDFVVAWISPDQDGSGMGVYAQRYNNAGIAQGAEFRVNTQTLINQTQPAVAMDDNGNFIITWTSNLQDGDAYGIYAQRYNSAGAAQGGEFLVNTYTSYIQNQPVVAMDSDGDFVITWSSYLQDGQSFGVYAKRFNSNGAAQGPEFKVNTYTTNAQAVPTVAMDSDGDFVIAWLDVSQDGSYGGIFTQRYNNAGAVQGIEFQVNTYIVNQQSLPAVAMDDSGNFAITWQSSGQDGNNYGIYAQYYDPSGALLGGEFRANTYTTASQFSPSIAMDSDGDYVVTWMSYAQDGSSYGIYAQRYSNSILPIELILFQGEDSNSGNLLEWTTATEQNNAGFELQRSMNAVEFEKICFIPGSGNSNQPQEYRFLDINPLPGVNYYRLKQTDFNGQFSYSDIIYILRGDGPAVAVYPNPVQETLYIQNSLGEGLLYNALGQTVKRFFITSTDYILDLSDLRGGTYWLEVAGQLELIVKQ